MLTFMKNETVKNNVRLAYMCFIVIYMAVREVTPLQFLIDNVIISAAVFAVGFALILWDLFTSRNCLKTKGIDFLVLFLIICVVSSVVNMKYGIGGNIKAIGAFVLQYFVFYACGMGISRERKEKELAVLSRVITIVWGIFAFISIHMYVFNIEYVVSGGSWGKTTQGFSAEYQRLWGVFQDSNYASFISIIAVFASIYLMIHRKKVITYVLCGLSILVQFSYIILAGSRAAKLLLFAASLLAVVYWFCLNEKKDIKKMVASIALSIGCFAVVVIGYTAFQYILPLYKSATIKVMYNSAEDIMDLYDSAYLAAKVPIMQDLSVLPEPPSPEPPVSSTPSVSSKPDSSNTQSEVNPPSSSEEPSSSAPQSNTSSKVEAPGAINRVDPHKDDPSNGRFKRWKHTFEVFSKTPVIGTSPRNLYAFAKEHAPQTLMALYGIAPHSGYFDVLVETGVLGTIALIGFLLMALVALIKKLFSEKRVAYLVFCAAGVFVFAGAAVFISDVYMVFTLGSVFFYTLFGYAIGEEESEKESYILKLFNLIFCNKK